MVLRKDARSASQADSNLINGIEEGHCKIREPGWFVAADSEPLLVKTLVAIALLVVLVLEGDERRTHTKFQELEAGVDLGEAVVAVSVASLVSVVSVIR